MTNLLSALSALNKTVHALRLLGICPCIPIGVYYRGNSALFDFPAKIGYPVYMTNEEIALILDKESYRIWDTTKVIKNQDYHDGLVKGLKMASKLVAKL